MTEGIRGTRPKIVEYDRSLGVWDFEGGAFVQIIIGGDVGTEEALVMVDKIVLLKRTELASRKTAPVSQTVTAKYADGPS